MRTERLYAFSRLGKFFVVDRETGSSFEVDEPVFLYLSREIPSDAGRRGVKEILDLLGEFDRERVRAVVEDLKRRYHRAICFNVTHTCNMACRYCFAGQGSYGGPRQIMSEEVALAGLKWLMMSRANTVDVDIFGGEPLIAWDIVKFILKQGTELARKHGKRIRFSLTTNGLLLTRDKLELLNDYDVNLTLSIDGPPHVNDIFRITPDGRGTYDRIIENFLMVEESRKGYNYYIRGTYTAWTLNFSEWVEHLADLGFKVISMEPVTGSGMPWHITVRHIPEIEREYERLARLYLSRKGTEREFKFYHFDLHTVNPPSAIRRYTACGAGLEYTALAPDGSIYPCHQLDGVEEFKLGNIFDVLSGKPLAPDIQRAFLLANALRKPSCEECWAKALCGGGCHAVGYFSTGSIMKPDPVQCEIVKIRLQYAIAVNAF